jgi:type II secretory ATPase GspE/PulE/Tfp pilus assembly ATPase PilB-like protein
MYDLGQNFISFLRQTGLLGESVCELLSQQNQAGQNVAVLIAKGGFLSDRILYRAIADFLKLPFLQATDLVQDAAVGNVLPSDFLLQYNVLPISVSGDEIVVAIGGTSFQEVSDHLFKRLSLRSSFQIAEPRAIRAFVAQNFSTIDAEFQAEQGKILRQAGASGFERFHELLLRHAVNARATDIHVVPQEGVVQFFYRVDGVMQPALALPELFLRYNGYLKILAEMDISERRIPQDGSFSCHINSQPYTVRASTIITDFGERVAMRLLSESNDVPDLVSLGYSPEVSKLLNGVANRPNGLIVVTGPTGSGKSSTLHAMIKMMDLIERNVLTVEDPVEYRVPLAAQTQVNKKSGYDFQSALRHFLRHDPDVILLGEMRDAETAKAAVDAAATGHLVLSTLHVTSTAGVANRLISMGLHPVSLAENLCCVVSQRLARRLCSHCGTQSVLDEHDCEQLGIQADQGLMGGRRVGCVHCRNTGYKGRLPLYEVLLVTESVRRLIQQEASADDIRKEMAANGFKTIFDCGREQVLAGKTDAAEIVRVLGSSA